MLFSDSLKGRTYIETLRTELEEAAWSEILASFPERAKETLGRYHECKVSPEYFDRLIHTLAARELIKINLPRERYSGGVVTLQLTPAGVKRVADLNAL